MKSLKEYPRKNAATLMEARTTPTQPIRSVLLILHDKYFQPWRLVQLQNVSKLVQDRDFADDDAATLCRDWLLIKEGGAHGVDREER